MVWNNMNIVYYTLGRSWAIWLVHVYHVTVPKKKRYGTARFDLDPETAVASSIIAFLRPVNILLLSSGFAAIQYLYNYYTIVFWKC